MIHFSIITLILWTIFSDLILRIYTPLFKLETLISTNLFCFLIYFGSIILPFKSIKSILSILKFSFNSILILFFAGFGNALSIILMLSFLSGTLLSSFTDSAVPFLDAFVTWGAVVATYMVAKKLLENWLYWLVIDSISILLFISRDLWLTACLFGVYIVIIVFGFRLWSKALKENNAVSS